jgi:hypothetical protein
MNPYSVAEQFLQAIFPDHVQHAIFANLNPPLATRKPAALDPARDCYWSIADFPDDGNCERTIARALAVRALVIDDVGTKVPVSAVELALGPATAVVETSSGNFQWVYRLAAPVPVAAWGGVFAEIEELVSHPLEGRDAVHLFRLPLGVNTKKGRDRFAVRLTQLNHGIELSLPSVGKYPDFPTLPAPSRGSLGREALERLMALISNDLERDGWIEVGHGLKALAACDEDGFEVFDTWSQLHPSYDAGKTRTAWDSFGVGGLKTQGGTLRARAERLNPEAFRKWEAGIVFDDGEAPPKPHPKAKPGITATPYQWVDPDKIRLRDWLYGDILIRKFISMTVAPGGVGKSSLVAVETLAQVTGQALLGTKPPAPLRVWLWNLEDPHEETTRKIQAAALHYQLSEADIGGRLFVDSGRDQKLVVAQMNGNGGPMIVGPVITALVEQIKLRGIDVVVVDPFVSCHELPENDNTAQDMVVKEWGAVAELGGCAVHLIDHTRKAPNGTEVATESARGAKAKTDAARIVRVINRMTKDEGEKVFGIKEPWRYFHTFNDKANMAPPVEARNWFHLESVGLGNGNAAAAFSVGAGAVAGDSVGVVTRWVPPSAQDLVTGDSFKAMVEAMGVDEWLMAPQAGEKWIGNAAAKALNLCIIQPKDRRAVKEVLMQWFKAGLLKEVVQTDANRMSRKFIKIAGGF